MSFLLDTNVVSEPIRTRPDRNVLRWIQAVPDTMLYISVLTLGELRHGAERLVGGAHKERLRLWIESDVMTMFEGRILPVELAVAERWGRLRAVVDRPLPVVDGLMAATALQHGLRLVTRNVDDFRFPGLEVVNPWEE